MSDPWLIREGEEHQSYIGDGVYASFDGYQIWLRTMEHGVQIALEPPVLHALNEYADNLKRLYTPPVVTPEAHDEQ